MRHTRLLATAACVALSMTLVLAQSRAGGEGSDRGSGGAPSHSSGGDRYRSESAPTPSAPTSNYSSAGGVGHAPSYSGGSNGYYGSSSYYGNYWDSTQAFYYDLLRSYRFLPVNYYMFRYSVGDSAVDQQLIRLALRDSIESSRFLVSYAEELSGLLDQYQSGSMDRSVFNERFKTTLNTIQRIAKTIRKDSRLAYLDQRKGVETAEPLQAKSIAELRGLVDELKQQALLIESGLETHYQEDMSRVIDLRTLKQPSFKTLSTRIERLSKAIMDSSREI